MNDKELLNLAAKAAGIAGNWRGLPGRPEQFIKLDYKPWNPLSSDGDALRLVMRLGLDLLHDASSVTVRKYDNVNQRMMCEITEHGDPVTGEPARRAITRAAAEIGRTHP